jgi:hypothetical protein
VTTDERERAAALAAEAKELFERKDYWAARKRYAESLALHEDAEVRRAYEIVLATVGPE